MVLAVNLNTREATTSDGSAWRAIVRAVRRHACRTVRDQRGRDGRLQTRPADHLQSSSVPNVERTTTPGSGRLATPEVVLPDARPARVQLHSPSRMTEAY